MSKKSITILIFIGVLVGAISIYAWTEPTGSMPETLNGPINTGTTSQTKSGELSATIFRDANDADYYINPSSSSLVSGDIESETSVTSAQFCIGTDCLTSWDNSVQGTKIEVIRISKSCNSTTEDCASSTYLTCPSGWTDLVGSNIIFIRYGACEVEAYCYKEVPVNYMLMKDWGTLPEYLTSNGYCYNGWTALAGSASSTYLYSPLPSAFVGGEYASYYMYCYKEF